MAPNLSLPFSGPTAWTKPLHTVEQGTLVNVEQRALVNVAKKTLNKVAKGITKQKLLLLRQILYERALIAFPHDVYVLIGKIFPSDFLGLVFLIKPNVDGARMVVRPIPHCFWPLVRGLPQLCDECLSG